MTNGVAKARGRLRACRIGVATALGLATAAAAAPAAAQGGWVNPDVFYEMQRELERLSTEIEIMRGAAPSGAGGPAPTADTFVRLQRLEQSVRDLTGQVEVLQRTRQQAAQQAQAKIAELEFRLSRLEGGETGPYEGGAPPFDPSASLGAGAGAAVGGATGRLEPLRPQNLPETGAGGSLGSIRTSQGAGPVSRPILDNPAGGQPQGAAPQASGGLQSAAAPSQSAFGVAPVSYEDALKSIQAGDHEQAEQQLVAFVDQNPSDPRVGVATYWLAETYRVRGRFREAAQTYAAGLRKHPDSQRAPDSWMRLGMSLAQLNQGAKACEAFAQVEQRFPDAPSRVLRETQTQARRAGCS